ncbi:MAG: hypothetical protein IPK79_12000 [Vampirovibrionales bacterium]|nr:hypothetical protein [Vampirovibrionales bacterium]
MMRLSLSRFLTAVLCLSALLLPADVWSVALTPADASSADIAIVSGLEPLELISDPAVEKSGAVQYGEVSNQTRVRIAVVPFDYRDPYNVGPFDERLGAVDCSMKGVYARCTYTQSDADAPQLADDLPPEPAKIASH